MSPVSLIAVQRVGCPGRISVIGVEHLAYLFLGSAVSQNVIAASWASDRFLVPSVVYARTVKGGLFRTGFSTLDEARYHLDRTRFVSIHRLAIVNVDWLVEVDPGLKVTRVGITVGADIEFLQVSRRRLKSLREFIGGLPRRFARGTR
jgi:hypothetical protein